MNTFLRRLLTCVAVLTSYAGATELKLDFNGISTASTPVPLGQAYASYGVSSPNGQIFQNALVFPGSGPGILYIDQGFNEAFRFDYHPNGTGTTPPTDLGISILDASGGTLMSMRLPPLAPIASGAGGMLLQAYGWDPSTGEYPHYALGTGYAIAFGWYEDQQLGDASYYKFDNLQFTSLDTFAPEPGTFWTLMPIFLAVAITVRFRRFRRTPQSSGRCLTDPQY